MELAGRYRASETSVARTRARRDASRIIIKRYYPDKGAGVKATSVRSPLDPYRSPPLPFPSDNLLNGPWGSERPEGVGEAGWRGGLADAARGNRR